ncbi:MAG: undecaprenyl-phosphate glucose phosphotransferase [Herpetosiphonaceae bacterium]|nr:undecaprenyl-phosphate glucose phosphotransferase [Herpetosiphonaceae bacterium]
MRHHPRFWLTGSLVLCDVIGVNAGLLGSYLLLYPQIRHIYMFPKVDQIRNFLLIFNLLCSAIFLTYRLYTIKRAASRVDEAYKVFVAMTMATLGASMIAALLHIGFTTWNVVATWLSATILVVLLRNIQRSLVYHARSRGFDNARTIIIGTGPIGQMIAHVIQNAAHLGYDLQGFVSDEHPVGSKVLNIPVLGRGTDLRRVVRVCRINEVLIALAGIPSHQVLDFVAACQDEPVSIKIYPDTFQIITNNEVSLGDLEGLPLLSVKSTPLDLQFNRILKRGLDLIGASLGLILLSPLMLLVAALIRFNSPGPVLFVQERVGVNGTPFAMLKFRSMRQTAQANGPGWTTPNDERRTPIGKFIRRYSIDELPQLVNVLLGDMSLVGPRAEQPYFVRRFSASIPRYMSRHKERVGLTGWAQVNGLRGNTSVEERTRYDLYYVENWSLLFDIKIIVRTIVTIFRGDNNAY